MTEQTNTPKLRFPEFKNEWSYDLLGDVVTNKSKKFDPKKEEATKDIELDSIEQNTGRLLDTYISNDFTSQKNKFKKGNVLYSKLRPYLNKYYYATIDGVCSSEIWVLNTLNKDVLVNKFLYYFIQTNRFGSVTNKSAGSKMPRADWELVKNIRLYKGSIKEQEKIGYFFSKLDQQIELEEKKLELLEQQKKGYMQKLFSQELRFKDENGYGFPNWRYNYLENYIIPYDEKTTENNQYPVLTSSREGLFLQKDYFTRDVASKDNTGYNVVPYGYFTYRHMSDDLIFKFNINYIVQKGIVSTLYPVFKTTNDLDNYFLKEILNNGNEFKKYALMQKQGGSRTYMYFSKLKKLKLHIPVLEEQQKIGDFLVKIDKLIENQSKKIDFLKQRKQGLLQKMFV